LFNFSNKKGAIGALFVLSNFFGYGFFPHFDDGKSVFFLVMDRITKKNYNKLQIVVDELGQYCDSNISCTH
jgi:hypothetical protein